MIEPKDYRSFQHAARIACDMTSAVITISHDLSEIQLTPNDTGKIMELMFGVNGISITCEYSDFQKKS
jgi:hypothetical protein